MSKEKCLKKFQASGGFMAECVLAKNHEKDCVGRNIEKDEPVAKFEMDFEFVFNNLRSHRKHIEGKVLTIIDASISDHEQRKAMKDLVRKAIWEEDGWIKSLLNVAEGKPPWHDNSTGIGELEEVK